ncbi:RNA-binding protein pop5 [Teratosphaeriaceae sp. CCFEE 6253]|nr:RNA-binding protein pop5 [Teratosphaeriaceae sp. CCFEE 6253]
MVRIKYRYLLVNMLNPDVKSSQWRAKPGEDVPYTMQFNQPTSDRMNAGTLMRMMRDGVSELFGDYGSGKVAGSLQVKYFSAATSTAIIRVSRDHYRLVWAALSFITHLPKPMNQPYVIQVVRVSGTIRKAEEEAIRRARLGIRRAESAAKRSGAAITKPATLSGASEEADDHDLDMLNGIEDPDEPGDVDGQYDES